MTDERHDEGSPDDGEGEANGDSPAFDPPEPGRDRGRHARVRPGPSGNDNIRDGTRRRADGLAAWHAGRSSRSLMPSGSRA